MAEVAAHFRCSRTTVWRLVHVGALPALRVGRGIRIRQADVDAYLAAGSGGAVSK